MGFFFARLQLACVYISFTFIIIGLICLNEFMVSRETGQ